ncbi:hypothetical protein RN001_002904 [Aquatica leii]|uniref:Uncharacterized protein n=1 Tax=Aquatica leii TaxID=1421715 RepID=A0AAN7SRE7_9COLE|nr:hypothetical protein RN001_002904 [Aquatica leii]
MSNDEHITKDNVERFINTQMGVKVTVTKAYKIGKRSQLSHIKARVQNFQEKIKIMTNKKKLAGTKIYIDNDDTVKEMEIQNIIKETAKQERSLSKTTKISYQKLYINGEQFIWNPRKNKLEKKETASVFCISTH